jgi:hypothetical protein
VGLPASMISTWSSPCSQSVVLIPELGAPDRIQTMLVGHWKRGVTVGRAHRNGPSGEEAAAAVLLPEEAIQEVAYCCDLVVVMILMMCFDGGSGWMEDES